MGLAPNKKSLKNTKSLHSPLYIRHTKAQSMGNVSTTNLANVSAVSDTSTQAMTEVALGLSMAFFSILIIALLSMQMPSNEIKEQTKTNAIKDTIEVSSDGAAAAQGTVADQMTIVFYYQQRLFDTDLHEITITQANEAKHLVLALPPNTDLKTAISLQKKFSVKQLSMSQIDNQWLAALQKSNLTAVNADTK